MTDVTTPVGVLPAWLVVSVTVVGYIGWMIGCGWWVHHWPLDRLDHDTWITRPRAFEDGGRWYERVVRIRTWKDRLPEGGAFFAGGFAKSELTAATADYLRRFVAETRRAEYGHWLMLIGAPLLFVVNAWWTDLVVVLAALIANVPCLLVQRYNRLRLQRLLRARG